MKAKEKDVESLAHELATNIANKYKDDNYSVMLAAGQNYEAGYLDGYKATSAKMYSKRDVKLAYFAGYDTGTGISKITAKQYIESLNK